MTSSLSVIYDACVLYPAPLRDFLMQLALTDLFRAKWTDRIHDEWIEHLLLKRPDLTRDRLERTRDLMNSHVRDCLVDGYEPLIEKMSLPDPDDRHVLAAAVHARCNRIVTFNLKDFPKIALSGYGLQAQHPDEFISELLDLDAEAVCLSAREHHARLKNPRKTLEEYLQILRDQGLKNTADKLSQSML